MILHPMPGITVYRLVKTKRGIGIVTSFNRSLNQIDVALFQEKMYGLSYEEVEVIPLVLKQMKR